MELFYRHYGTKGEKLVILHGLYGASDNWVTFGRKLANAGYEVYLIDQRNHGNSPHHPTHTYIAMREDLLNFFVAQDIPKATIIGHSMGGKTAMSFTAQHPDKVEKLLVLDISPKHYASSGALPRHILMHQETLKHLLELPLHQIQSRAEAEEMLSGSIPSNKLRQFLLKNLKREAGVFRWKFNLPAISLHLEEILNNACLPEDVVIKTPTLFVRGALSDYLTEQDYPSIRQHFTRASFSCIENAGHWLHVEQAERLMQVIRDYIRQSIQ